MKDKTNTTQSNNDFYRVAFVLVVGTILLAYYLSNLLFFGKNSLEVYDNLQLKQITLQQNIRTLQLKNAKLQKQYFELKNLEPEEL